MPDQDMAVVVVAAAAAAIAVGGAALALTYRCCPEILGKHRKKKNKIDDDDHRPRDDDPAAASEHLQRDELDQHHSDSGYSRKIRDEEVRSSLLEPKKRPATARSVEEIKARYGRATKSDAGAAAGLASQARNKLMERGEKLKNIDDKTEELQSQAESFASLAEELANKMKSRKWWERF